MIELPKYNLPEVIPQDELAAWRASIRKVNNDNCPGDVREFIDAIASKLDDFYQIGKDHEMITGFDLMRSGMTSWKGKSINPWEIYDLEVPKMVACDHHTAMHRIFKRKGKQGLIDFCRAKVKGTALEAVLYTLNVIVFNEERPEFQKIMRDIEASRKLETQLKP